MPSERALRPSVETGFRGMNANEEFPVPTGFVSLAENYFLDGRVYTMRPGVYATESSTALSSGDAVQCIVHFEELDGTLHTVAICNADLFEYNWGTDSWSSTDLAGVGITVSATALISAAVYRGMVIFTDGINKPFMWDPSGPTFTTLANAPVAAGVTVYYDKVFFFAQAGANSNVFEWSDEGDPANGYGGADQDWEFVQTDGGAITAMVGLNDVLPVFKQDSAAALRGRVEDTFQTDAVREGFSETEGASGHRGVVVVDGDVYYLSQSGPRLLRAGARLHKLNIDADGVDILKPIWDGYDQAEIANALGVYDRERRHVFWLMTEAGDTGRRTGVHYNVEDGSFATIRFESNFDFSAMAKVEDPDGNEFVMMGGENGKVYVYGDETQITDDGTPFTGIVRSRQYGSEVGPVQKRLGVVDMLVQVGPIGTTAARLRTRPFVDGGERSLFASEERVFPYETTGRKRYRRGFNHVGYTVGWDMSVKSDEGKIDLHQVITNISTVGAHASRG